MAIPLVLTAAASLMACAPVPKTYTFFSGIEGRVTKNGKPLPNARIIRSYESAWFQNPTSQETTTDDRGNFSFRPARTFQLIYFFHTPVIEQNITLIADGRKLTLWDYTKMDYEPQGEIDTSRPWVKPKTSGGVRTTPAKMDDGKTIRLDVAIDSSG